VADAKPTGFTCGYYLAPLVTAFHIQPLSGLGCLMPNPQVSPVAIHIQPRSGLTRLSRYHRFHLWLLSRSARYCVSYSTPIGVGVSDAKPTGFTCGYSYSTPIGVDASFALPQVPPVAIHIQPLSGLTRLSRYHRFHLWLLSRSARYCV
jgi:hypothetical protein